VWGTVIGIAVDLGEREAVTPTLSEKRTGEHIRPHVGGARCRVRHIAVVMLLHDVMLHRILVRPGHSRTFGDLYVRPCIRIVLDINLHRGLAGQVDNRAKVCLRRVVCVVFGMLATARGMLLLLAAREFRSSKITRNPTVISAPANPPIKNGMIRFISDTDSPYYCLDKCYLNGTLLVRLGP
jgi:hypothetical protein